MDELNRAGRKRNRAPRLAGAALLLAAAVGVILLVKSRETPLSPPPAQEQRPDAAAGRADTVPPAVKDTALHPEPSATARIPQKGRRIASADTAVREPAEPPDTAAAKSGTGASVPSDGCAGDTLAPWVWPEPSGGLHRGPVSVKFSANKPCDVSWRFETETLWRPWSGAPLAVERSVTVVFRAVDRCGRAMEERTEYYEIAGPRTAGLCPADMELVRVGTASFCIDRYEWPNRKGALPMSYVSLSQAEDSCFTAGKRLCTSEEWSLACAGPYSYAYPYGQEYERYACVTHDTTARPSGSRPECRAFFGMFDMSGNLLEWTSTPSRANRQFNDVMGGFWQSGPRSGCFDTRYSYFPQNRHNPVGFRCCKACAADAPAEK
ncbi:MAG: SUMF1/EgtB/PvdO family nonheme iron enzyme [Chitinispirillaceae bacterium]|nr:SUMF1/EgtB/PvdO family nonheme iron enzyme [Chitinispirillaceae bacterium]